MIRSILTKPFFDKLVHSGKIVGSTMAQLARVPIGLSVRKGGPKPDISSVEAFKKTLLDAKFVTYGDPAMGDAAGIHIAQTVETLGLAGEMRPKTRLISPSPGQSGAQFLTGLFQRGETEGRDGPDQRPHGNSRRRDRRAASSRAAGCRPSVRRRYSLDLSTTVRGKDFHRFPNRGVSQGGL